MYRAKRILILTADAGFGHRSAANAIAVALQELHGDACEITVANPLADARVPALLRHSQVDHDRLVRDMRELYRIGYEASDTSFPSLIVESALTLMLFEVLGDLIKERRPDAVVITYPMYQAPLAAFFALSRRRVPVVTVVTDLTTVHRLWFHDVVDLCLVPTEQARELALENGLEPDKVRITGIPVHPALARENRPPPLIRRELGWRPDMPTALVVGSKRVSNLDTVLRVLNHSGLNLQLVVVAGGDDALYERLQATEWHGVVHLYNYVSNMPEMMCAADCILCKAGGLIVTEALAAGLPILLIDVLPGQECGNAEYVINGGAAELAEDPIAVLETLYHWFEGQGDLLAQRAARARALGRKRAAYDVAEQVWVLAEAQASLEEGQRPRRRISLRRLFSRPKVRERRLNRSEG